MFGAWRVRRPARTAAFAVGSRKDTLKRVAPEPRMMKGEREAVEQSATLISRSRSVSDVSFLAFLDSRTAPRVHWASPAGLELAGGGVAARVTASGPDRFDALRRDARRVFGDVDHDGPSVTRPRMVGGVSYTAERPGAPWEGFAAGEFLLPAVQLTRGPDGTYLTVNRYDADPAAVERELAEAADALAALPAMTPSGDPPGVTDRQWLTARADWLDQVERAVSRIRAGDLRKVVLATALRVGLSAAVSAPAVLERLRRDYPDCYRFLVQPGERAFFGPPPERLVAVDGRTVRTEALAGSAERGETPAEDAELARSLADDPKTTEEQRLVTETIRDQLAAFGTVETGERTVRKLATIQHLQTPVRATLDRDRHVLELVEALHPTPAVGGLPLDAALRTIRETESFDRGWYASPVGWFDAAGDGEFAVAIRSGVTDGDSATLFAGNGIVADSDPEAEWAELQPKVRPILDELTSE